MPKVDRTIQNSGSKPPSRPSPIDKRSLWSLICIAAIAWSLAQTGLFGQDVINPGGWSLFLRFLQASLHPDLSPELLSLTLNATLVTLAYAICGTALSVLLGSIGGVLASQVWWQSVFLTQTRKVSLFSHHKVPWLGIRAFLSIPRAIHELIWGLFFVNIFGLDPLVAILAITIPFGAITAKVFSEILDETPRQPLIALLSSGVSPLKAFIYSLIPQAFPYLLSYTFYRFECSIRSAAVLGIIGAGGLGYQILLSLQSLRYEQMWTFFLALFLLNGAVDFWSALLRHRLGSPSRLDLNFLKLNRRKQQQVSYQDPILFASIIGAVGLLLFSFWNLKVDYTQLWAPRTVQLLGEVVREVFPANIHQSQGELFNLSIQTIAMSILAIAGAGLGGMLLSFPAAHNFLLPGGVLNPISQSKHHWFWGTAILLLTRSLLLISRAIPAPIWALILLFVMFPGILPGAIALGIHNLGILGRLMAEVIENLDERPLRSLQALGASGSQVFLYGVLPNALPRFMAYILYRWEVCMRETVIVGLVGAGGLGRLLTEQLSSFDYKSLVTTLLCFMVLTFLVDLLSASARRSLR
jgi:phosphonate transport system permease protein